MSSTVLRIKRRRDDSPIESLMVAEHRNSRRRIGGLSARVSRMDLSARGAPLSLCSKVDSSSQSGNAVRLFRRIETVSLRHANDELTIDKLLRKSAIQASLRSGSSRVGIKDSRFVSSEDRSRMKQLRQLRLSALSRHKGFRRLRNAKLIDLELQDCGTSSLSAPKVPATSGASAVASEKDEDEEFEVDVYVADEGTQFQESDDFDLNGEDEAGDVVHVDTEWYDLLQYDDDCANELLEDSEDSNAEAYYANEYPDESLSDGDTSDDDDMERLHHRKSQNDSRTTSAWFVDNGFDRQAMSIMRHMDDEYALSDDGDDVDDSARSARFGSAREADGTHEVSSARFVANIQSHDDLRRRRERVLSMLHDD